MGNWDFDPAHSTMGFSIRHMMVTNVHGTFRDFAVDATFDPASPTLGHVVATIQAASIDTGQDARDTHLRSADFLDVEHFPTITFTSTGIDHRQDNEYRLRGDLTIHGQTRAVVFDAEYLGDAVQPQGGRSAGFTAHGKIRRSDFGLTWNMGMEAGGVVVADEFKFEIDLELTQPAVMPATPVPATAVA